MAEKKPEAGLGGLDAGRAGHEACRETEGASGRGQEAARWKAGLGRPSLHFGFRTGWALNGGGVWGILVTRRAEKMGRE